MGRSPNRPVYAAIGVTHTGEKEVLGAVDRLRREGAMLWMSVLTGVYNLGVKDVFFAVCGGLRGLPEVVANG
jgi:transposase-like protein